jgi:hypothetical protein
MKLTQCMAAFALSMAFLVNGTTQTRDVRRSPPFSIALKASSNSYKLGEPIRLSLTITNTSQSTIGLIAGPGMVRLEQHFVVVAVGPDGKVVQEREYGLQIHGKTQTIHNRGSGSSYMEAVAPRESVYHEIDANKLYDFSIPGTYDLYVQRDYEADSSLLVKSNHIKVVVVE